MKHIHNFAGAFFALLLFIVLCGCAAGNAAGEHPAAPAVPNATVQPTPEPTEAVIDADMTSEEILAMGQIKSLRSIDASASREYDALMQLRQMLPDCEIYWEVEYSGQVLGSDTEEITVTEIGGGETALRFLPELKKVDLLSCDVSVEQMDMLSQLCPDVDFLWNVRFGTWEVRSDITCFSTLQSANPYMHRYSTEELYPLLRYCRKLRALDLGHNALTDISLIGRMEELQVLIIGDNPYIEDISPLENCKELMYIECFSCNGIQDFSPLGELHQLKDINASYNYGLNDAGFLDGLTEPGNVWLLETGVGYEALTPYKEKFPDSLFMCGTPPVHGDAMAYGWRAAHRNIAIRNAFTYWPDVEEFISWDNVTYREGSHMYEWMKGKG